ncbi:MAG: transglutaminase domain-containing protein [Proteobacteria bacterium]|nr:transglutaminase domain-containing protein [Pseudomonadota bacterium]
MRLRLIIGTCTCIALGGIAWINQLQAPAAIQSAQRLSGERWYQVFLNTQQVGYWHTLAQRDFLGRWHFTRELRFGLSPGHPVSVTHHLTFEAQPPFALSSASYHNERRQTGNNSVEGVTFVRTLTGYEAIVTRDDFSESRHMTWSYALADYLAFESWLTAAAPTVDTVTTVPTLDFSRLAVVQKKYRVDDHNETGYVVANAAPIDSTIIQLNEDFVPIELSMAGIFDLKSSSRSAALTQRSSLGSASYYVPINVPLYDHTNIKRLVVEVSSSTRADRLFAAARQQNDVWTLTLSANPLSHGPREGTGLEETLHFPTSSKRVNRLAREATAGSVTDTEKLTSLTSFVHNYLSYDPNSEPIGVLTSLGRRTGDCTEFADLFTTLARTLGMPSRTIIGLAYTSRDEPAFAFHAWNEVAVNGVWQAVDPTWNQLRVDATHIPLPNDQGAALQLLTGSTNLRFSVLDVVYF